MSHLPATQQAFQHAIRSSDAQPGLFVDGPRDDGGGLALYLVAYRARLASALRDNYVGLHRALGDAAFDELAGAYIDACPSRHRSIRWFGHDLADYLDATPDALPHPALVDLARMDWALTLAFDASDTPPLTAADLAAVAPEQWPALRFALHPSAALLALQWHVEPIWHQLNADADAQTDAPEPGTHTMLIWRGQGECHWRSLDAIEAAALTAAAAGESFADLCEHVAACLDDSDETPAAHHVVALLQRWLADELLIAPH